MMQKGFAVWKRRSCAVGLYWVCVTLVSCQEDELASRISRNAVNASALSLHCRTLGPHFSKIADIIRDAILPNVLDLMSVPALMSSGRSLLLLLAPACATGSWYLAYLQQVMYLT